MEDDERERGTKPDQQKTAFWVDSIVSVPRKFQEQIGYTPDPGQEKVIFPTPKNRKERELIDTIINNVSQVEISRERTREEVDRLKAMEEANKEDTSIKVDRILREAVLALHPTLLGIGGIASSEFVKGQEELKNKGLEELSRRKMGEVYQAMKAKELEND